MPVSFIKESDTYNYETGNTDATVINQTDTLANVSDTSAEMCNLMYGKLKTGTYTVIIQNGIDHVFDYILIDSKKYTVNKIRRLRLTTTYFVSGGA